VTTSGRDSTPTPGTVPGPTPGNPPGPAPLRPPGRLSLRSLPPELDEGPAFTGDEVLGWDNAEADDGAPVRPG